MRHSNKTVKVQAPISYNNIKIHTEEFVIIEENKALKQIKVTIAYKDSEDSIIEQKDFVIFGEHYNLLMSQSPDFAPNKPENEYREQDLWYVVDLINA